MSPKGRERRGGGGESGAVYIFVCLFLSVCLAHLAAKSRRRQAGSPSTGRERSEADQTQAN